MNLACGYVGKILPLIAAFLLPLGQIAADEANIDDLLIRVNHELTVHSVFATLKSIYQSDRDQKFLTNQHGAFRGNSRKVGLKFELVNKMYELKLEGKTWARIYDFDFEQKSMRVNGKRVSFADGRSYVEIFKDLKQILDPKSAINFLHWLPSADAYLGWLIGLAIAGITYFAFTRFAKAQSDPIHRCMIQTKVTDIFPPQNPASPKFVNNAFSSDRAGFKQGQVCDNLKMPRDMDQRMQLMWTAYNAGKFTDQSSCVKRKMGSCEFGGFNMREPKAVSTCRMFFHMHQHCQSKNAEIVPSIKEDILPPMDVETAQ